MDQLSSHSIPTHTSPLLLDGGMGRELHRVGAPFRQPEWSALALMERPDLVQKVHETFLAAGANIITTNSYAIVPFHIGADRFTNIGKDLAHLAGTLGRQAIDAYQASSQTPNSFSALAGSLPPVCGSYRPDLFDAHIAEDLFATLVEGLSPSVDLWLAETQSSIAEMTTARQAISADDTRPFWGSFTLDDAQPEILATGQNTLHLRSGEPLEDAIQAAIELNLDALLFNCSDPRIMATALHTAQKIISQHTNNTPLKLGVYANGFVHNNHHVEGEGANEAITPIDTELTPERYARFAHQWHEEGAHIIGGCCGIGPEHISYLAKSFS